MPPAPTSAPQSRGLTPLALWHLLSLDAPTVAALWTWFIARCCRIALPWQALAAMFLAVWTLYAADRLLDARDLDTANPAPLDLEARHFFHHRHRRAFLVALMLAAMALAALLPTLFEPALRLYTLLGALLFAWFLLIHTRLAASNRLPKELAVGIFFPAAIFIPTVARRPDMRLALLAPALLFAAICALNCLFLYAWEHPGPRPQAHWTTRLATAQLLPATLLIVSTAAAAAALHSASPVRLPAAACALSGLALLLLHRRRARLSPVSLRAAADLALLTPLLLAPFLPALQP
jgi:hypothetical protein